MMTLKEFFELTLVKLLADAAYRKDNTDYLFWTDGMCIAMSQACFSIDDVHKDAADISSLYNKAKHTLKLYRPESASVYWWPVEKSECTYEQALAPRIAVLERIIALL